MLPIMKALSTCRFMTLTFLLLLPVTAFAVSPEITSIVPPGGRRGTTFEITVSGYNLKDTVGALFYTPGLKAKDIKVVDESTVRLRLDVPKTTPLGQHPIRLQTVTRLSQLRTISIGDFSSVPEEGPNNDQDHAIPLELNTTATGRIEEGGVDFYKVQAKKGERLSVEVEGIRLGATLFDSKITILDGAGKQIASCDDTSLLRQDPFVTIRVPNTGTYYVTIQETVGRGSDESLYRMHIGSFPRPKAIFPLGGPRKRATSIRWIGDAEGPKTQKVNPQEIEANQGFLPQENNTNAPSCHPFRLVDFDDMTETEANDKLAQANVVKLPVPFAVNGILQKSQDVDWFRFRAKKGIELDIQVYAARMRTPVDSVLALYDSDKKLLIRNDDGISRDSEIRFEPPQTGDYYLCIRDLRGKGGPEHAYRIEVTQFRPRLNLFLPRMTRRSQDRQTIIIPRGGRIATFLGARRTGIRGEVVPTFSGLPKGVRVSALPIERGRYLGLALFEAEANSPLAAKLIDVNGETGSPKIRGKFQQSIDLVSGPADALYHKVTVHKAALAVVKEAPFSIRLLAPKTPLVQDGKILLEVIAKRHKGFTGDIEVSLPFLPEWLQAPKRVTIPSRETKATIPLTSTADAEVRDWEILATARAEFEEGYVYISSRFVQLSVVPPKIVAKLQNGRGRPGASAKIRLELVTPLSARTKASVELLGLPKGVTADQPAVNQPTRKLDFTVKIDKALADGEYKGIYCEITQQIQGRPVVTYVGRGTVLYIGQGATGDAQSSGKKLSPLDRLRKERERKAKTKPQK
ncbi:MAG: PPC domain-containing protein [Gemmataceae bacterium]